jgi:hypothetical protein
VVKDGNLITSRDPGDLLQFDRAIVEHFGPGTVARERRYALPHGWLVGGLGVLALGLAARWLAREHRGGSWLPEWLEGSKHPGEASLEAYEEMVRQDITGPLDAAATATARARTQRRGLDIAPTSSP